MRHRVFALIALLCFSSIASPQEPAKVPNPEYQRWSAFKVGSATKLLQVTESDGAKTQVMLIHTLVELTPQKAVVETRTQVTARDEKSEIPPARTEHPAVIDDPHGPIIDPEGITIPKPKVGSEDLIVNGQTYKCRTEQFTLRIDRDVIDNKLWLSPEVPGGVVRSQSTVKGPMPGATTMTLVDCVVKK